MIALIILGFLGFLDASYLTVSHYSNVELSCNITNGCAEVTNSKYSVFMGIPLALMGVFYYLTILLTSLYYFDSKNSKVLKIYLPLTTTGFLFSLYLVFLQIWVIEAICQYCMFSAMNSTLLFGLSLGFLRPKK